MARPAELDPLFRSIPGLKGVGPQLGRLFNRFFGAAEGQDAIVLDLLLHMPQALIDRRSMAGAAQAEPGTVVTLKLHVDAHRPPPRGKPQVPHRVLCHDDTGEIDLVFFRATGGWVEKSLPVGEVRYVSGRVAAFNGGVQMAHPDYILAEDKADALPRVEPVYPLTHGLSSKLLLKLVRQSLALVSALNDWIPPDRLRALGWPSFAEALRRVHAPQAPGEAEPWGPARKRLAYDEYLAGQLALLIVRSELAGPRGVPRTLTGKITGRVRAALPFALTAGQEAAIGDILKDLQQAERMSRLVQGDVGAGKTVVALMAMAAVAESGAQSALMAPTEILATQHYRGLKPLADAAGLGIRLMTGKMSAADRRAALQDIADGSAAIVVGTHALFQQQVSFHNLGLAVVDEQHRFGVHQRLALNAKSAHTDLLVMTATPIPRSLVLTHFGDMAVSILPEKPKGRQPIETATLPASEEARLIDRIAARLDNGAQAFWICPLVEEAEGLELMSAEDRFRTLQARFGDKVALVHGRMSAADKEAAMGRFARGEAQLLVATTVVEVGVDVPKATIIVIEHAERFGLAQLHQLRGRVGRGSEKSYCILLYSEPLSLTARERLQTIRSTDDGFVIAEKDLELRGPGDVLGTRQSGMPGYRLALPDVHSDLLPLAHDDARALLDRNPGLTGPDGDAARVLLYLFRKDLALPLIHAG